MSTHNLPEIFDVWVDSHLSFFSIYKKSMDALAVAVSGGPDSMALLDVMIQYALTHNISLHVLSVDHGLRDEAKAECEMVKQYVDKHKSDHIYHRVLCWNLQKPETAIMENARAARYDLMVKYCKDHNIRFLFIGHHQDDQAETFLIRLAKGSGLDGLSAIRPIQEYGEGIIFSRPFLQTPKLDLIAYCDQHDVPYVCDPSNKNETYLRPRLRASMDILAQEGLTPKRLAMTAKRLSRAREALEEIASNAYQVCLADKKDNSISFDFTSLKSCPWEIVFRVVSMALEGFRINSSYNVRMEKLESLIDDLIQNNEFKPRTLGGCRFSLHEKGKKILLIETENKVS